METMIRSFRDLDVWRASMDLAVDVYRLTAFFPRDERFGLTAQVRKAVASIPSNIAEGNRSFTPGENRNRLSSAAGSLGEVDTQLELAERLRYLEAEELVTSRESIDRIGRMLTNLNRSLRR